MRYLWTRMSLINNWFIIRLAFGHEVRSTKPRFAILVPNPISVKFYYSVSTQFGTVWQCWYTSKWYTNIRLVRYSMPHTGSYSIPCIRLSWKIDIFHVSIRCLQLKFQRTYWMLQLFTGFTQRLRNAFF